MPTATSEITKETGVADEPQNLAEKLEAIPFDDSRVVKYPDPILRRIAAPIIAPADVTGLQPLIDEMGGIMQSAHGVGLAAPQVGKSVRLFVYDVGDGLQALLNPVILKKKGEQIEPEEGCLSIPGLRGVVKRAAEITVKALDRTGRPTRFRAFDFEARVIQHELDHLDGVLFIDHADPATLHMVGDSDDERGEGDDAPAE
jgi:peptide deformylase